MPVNLVAISVEFTFPANKWTRAIGLGVLLPALMIALLSVTDL